MSNAGLTVASVLVLGMRLVAELIPDAALKAIWASALADLEAGRDSEEAAAGAAMATSIFRRQAAGGLAVAKQTPIDEHHASELAQPHTRTTPVAQRDAANRQQCASHLEQAHA